MRKEVTKKARNFPFFESISKKTNLSFLERLLLKKYLSPRVYPEDNRVLLEFNMNFSSKKKPLLYRTINDVVKDFVRDMDPELKPVENYYQGKDIILTPYLEDGRNWCGPIFRFYIEPVQGRSEPPEFR